MDSYRYTSSSQVEWFAAARRPPPGVGRGLHEELQPGAGGGRRGASEMSPADATGLLGR